MDLDFIAGKLIMTILISLFLIGAWEALKNPPTPKK